MSKRDCKEQAPNRAQTGPRPKKPSQNHLEQTANGESQQRNWEVVGFDFLT
jgi:hypothetical protein